MGTTILNSLEIRNFRGFKHLQIETLGRVNLIVGKNNVGKSSLLEALHLYARRGSPGLIQETLRGRDESRGPSVNRSVEIEDMLEALRYLFYGRKDVRSISTPIQLGPTHSSDEVLSISIGWYEELRDDDVGLKRRLLQPEEYSIVDNPVPRFNIQVGKQPRADYPLRSRPSSIASTRLSAAEADEIRCILIPSGGLENSQIGVFWDNISLRSLEKDIIAGLQIIAPGVEGLSIIGGDTEFSRSRTPIVKIGGIDDPMPLRSLGDGMQRMLGISLALVNAADGMLLIDEVENGIHYSVQQDLWQLVFRLASRLNVQVFATTHSWDCIKAFQKAALDDTQEQGVLIRLSLKMNGEIGVTTLDEEELAIATREQIEVR